MKKHNDHGYGKNNARKTDGQAAEAVYVGRDRGQRRAVSEVQQEKHRHEHQEQGGVKSCYGKSADAFLNQLGRGLPPEASYFFGKPVASGITHRKDGNERIYEEIQRQHAEDRHLLKARRDLSEKLRD